MPNPCVAKRRQYCFLALTLLIAVGAQAHPAQLFFHSPLPGSHIFPYSPLYNNGDTVLLTRNNPSAGYIRRERNGDLIIEIPNVVSEKYMIRFFDNDNIFLFEVRQIRDPLLIVEKNNFRHSGLFHYELYRESQMIEKNTFFIRRE